MASGASAWEGSPGPTELTVGEPGLLFFEGLTPPTIRCHASQLGWNSTSAARATHNSLRWVARDDGPRVGR